MDELWSFVDDRGNEQWLWLALDAQTRAIVGVQIGERSAVSAQALWKSMPPVYRQGAVIYTDHWSAYGAVLPKQRHRSVDKDSGFTSYIEPPHSADSTCRQERTRLYPQTTGITPGKKVLVVFQKFRESPCSHLEFCASLQCDTTTQARAYLMPF